VVKQFERRYLETFFNLRDTNGGGVSFFGKEFGCGRYQSLLVELTINLAKPEDRHLLGGDVDMVEIKRDGSINWVAKKQNCPEN